MGRDREMRFVGAVRGTNSKGDLIVKSNGHNRIQAGDEIVDRYEKPIGRTRRVFGPVDAPYVSIRLKKRVSDSELAGIEVYMRTKDGD